MSSLSTILCTSPLGNAAVPRHFQTNTLNGPVPEITVSVLTPSQIKRLLEHHKSNYIIDGISSAQMAAWQSTYPEILNTSSFKYEYDSFMSRMTIIFVPELIRDCFEIFFKTTVRQAIDAFWFDGFDGFENYVEIDSNSTFVGFSGDYSFYCRKQPDAYCRINDGSPFPTVVVETSWLKHFEYLQNAARMWLLGTRFVTKVVIVLGFTEAVQLKLGNWQGGSENPVIGRVGEDMESVVLVDPLHPRQSLWASLLGPVEANLYVFRANAKNTGIDQIFTAAILPEQYPIGYHYLKFALTMRDIFGNSTIPGFINPQESITFSLEELRRILLVRIQEDSELDDMEENYTGAQEKA